MILTCYTIKPESSVGLKNLQEAKEFSKSKEKSEFSPKAKHKQLSCKNTIFFNFTMPKIYFIDNLFFFLVFTKQDGEIESEGAAPLPNTLISGNLIPDRRSNTTDGCGQIRCTRNVSHVSITDNN